MRDKQGRLTDARRGLSDPEKTTTAVSTEDRRDFAGRFTTAAGKVKSDAAGKRVDKG